MSLDSVSLWSGMKSKLENRHLGPTHVKVGLINKTKQISKFGNIYHTDGTGLE